MPETRFEEFHDTAENRRALVAFLSKSEHLNPAQGGWERRLAHWWDENPAAAQNPYRGRVLYHGKQIVGYGGAIPVSYALKGRELSALIATTLEVEPQYPKAGLPILLKMRSLAEHSLIIHTTPSQKLQHTLVKMGAMAETRTTCHFYPGHDLSWMQRRRWPTVDASMRVITSMNEVRAMVRPFQSENRIEKWQSPASLRWQLSTPTHDLQFVGAADISGTLHSFLILALRRVRGLQAWHVLEAFSTRDDSSELHALAGCIASDPTLLPQKTPLLTISTFPGDHTWDAMPGIIQRKQSVCHYFLMPAPLSRAPKHTVMAEGDLIL
jgi:hypothetical protein